MTRVPPTKVTRSRHHTAIMTPKQAQRLAAGVTESSPADYGINLSETNVKAREARRRIEDLKLKKELGLIE